MARLLTKEAIQKWTVYDVATNLQLEGFRDDVISKLKGKTVSLYIKYFSLTWRVCFFTCP